MSTPLPRQPPVAPQRRPVRRTGTVIGITHPELSIEDLTSRMQAQLRLTTEKKEENIVAAEEASMMDAKTHYRRTQSYHIATSILNRLPGAPDPTSFLLAANNATTCHELQVGTVIGRGGNAVVYMLLSPSAQQFGLVQSLPLTLKSNTVPLRLEPTAILERRSASSELPSSSVKQTEEQRQLAAYGCWQPGQSAYLCPFEHETEVLILALASKLFADGVTPHMPLHMASFTCTSTTPSLHGTSSHPHDGVLNTVQERYGVLQAPYNGHVHSLVHLPELLQITYADEHIVRQSELMDAIQATEKGTLSSPASLDAVLAKDFPKTSLTVRGESLLKRVAVEIMLAVLHTLALGQNTLGLQLNDLKPANILFKFDDNSSASATEPYFRGQSLSRYSHIAYHIGPPPPAGAAAPSSLPAEQQQAQGIFYIPNRGFVAKLIDFGMAAAYRVPVRREKQGEPGGITNINEPIIVTEHVEVSNHAYTSRRHKSVRCRATLGVLATTLMAETAQRRGGPNENQRILDRLIREARRLGCDADDATAESMAREAMRTQYIEYQREFLRISNSRNQFGLSGQYQPGYDAHYFVATLAEQMRHWLPSRHRLDDPGSAVPDDYGPIFYVQQTYKMTLDAETARPALDHVSASTPEQILHHLYALGAATFQPGYQQQQQQQKEPGQSRVGTWLAPYCERPPDVHDENILHLYTYSPEY